MKNFNDYINENQNNNDSKEVANILYKMDFKNSRNKLLSDIYSDESEKKSYLYERKTEYKSLLIDDLYYGEFINDINVNLSIEIYEDKCVFIFDLENELKNKLKTLNARIKVYYPQKLSSQKKAEQIYKIYNKIIGKNSSEFISNIIDITKTPNYIILLKKPSYEIQKKVLVDLKNPFLVIHIKNIDPRILEEDKNSRNIKKSSDFGLI